jgi:hypothetical protein
MTPNAPTKKKIDFNRPQLRFIVSQPKEASSIWSRATGKSSLIAWLMHLVVQQMPRSAWALVGSTYMQILTRTLPSTIGSLERIGYIKDVHYFIGRRPPPNWNWPTPYEPPVKYDHFIQFYTGAGFHLVSQDKGGGSSRGLNIDGIIADESLLLDKERFDQETSATNRGNLRYFSKVPLHHGIFHFSSMPYGDEGKWLLKGGDYYEKENREAGPYDFTFLRSELIKLQLKFIDNKDIRYRMELWPKMQALQKEITFYKSKRGFLYSEANVFENLSNVGIKYIEQQRRELADFIFLLEILNQRPEKIEGGFYPYLQEAVHSYSSFNNPYLDKLGYDRDKLLLVDSRMDEDCISTQPLRIAVDWGSRLNCMSIGQDRPGGFNFLNALFVKHPLILDDLAKKFCDYYQYHLKKEVFFAYDHTGNTLMANSNLTYADQFAHILRENGWTVNFVAKAAPPLHQEKYLLWSRLLKEDNLRMPKIRFNKHNCKYLLISMKNAPAKDGDKGIEKHKGSERSKSLPQEEATHFSDTADILVYALYRHLLNNQSAFVDMV